MDYSGVVSASFPVHWWNEAGHDTTASRGVRLTCSTQQLSPAFFRFIGVAEVLGGLGLILPGFLRIRPGLTPLAAAGLVTIMIGAIVFTMATGGNVMTLIPCVVGLLAAFIAYGRWRLTPLRGK